MVFHPFFISRRRFLKRCATTAAATGLPLWYLQSELDAAEPAVKSLSPNDRPGIGLIGCGGMGRGDAGNASRFGDVVAVCDVDENHLRAAVQQFTKEKKTPEAYTDFRKLLEDKNVQVVVQATPDHWHTLANLGAVLAKKDVYGEKPLTLTIDEGKRLVSAVRQNKTIFQTGSQQRSDKLFHLACSLVRQNRLGKLQQVTCWIPAGLRGGPFAASAIPQGLNWDLWLGQARKVDYVKERCHTTFRYWFDYSGGTMTDWGAHHNDIARWGIGLEAPDEVEGKSLADPVQGGYSAFSEYEVRFRYSNGVQHIVKTTADSNIFGGVVNKNGQVHGVKFEGTEGWIWVTRGDIQASKDELLSTPLPEGPEGLYRSGDHMRNFFDCIRSRKLPICDVEVGHRSASLCHIGVIALRIGRKLHWDGEAQQFTGDFEKEANAHVTREMRKPYDYSYIA